MNKLKSYCICQSCAVRTLLRLTLFQNYRIRNRSESTATNNLGRLIVG